LKDEGKTIEPPGYIASESGSLAVVKNNQIIIFMAPLPAYYAKMKRPFPPG